MLKYLHKLLHVYKNYFDQRNMATLAQSWGMRFGQDFVFGDQGAC